VGLEIISNFHGKRKKIVTPVKLVWPKCRKRANIFPVQLPLIVSVEM